MRVGSTITAGVSGRATFFTPGTRTGVICRSGAIVDVVRRNPTVPGTAVEQLTHQAFRGCTTNISGARSVRAIQVVGLPYRTTITSRQTVTVFNLTTRLVLNSVIGTITCTYHANRIQGTAFNISVRSGARNKFVNQRFTRRAGSAACPRSGTLSVTFGPMRNNSVRGHPFVFYNR